MNIFQLWSFLLPSDQIPSPLDEQFYPFSFSKVGRQNESSHNPVESILLEDYISLSQRLDKSQIQEACTVRNVLKTRALAQALFDESGELNLATLKQAIQTLKNFLYHLGPGGEHDAIRDQHILNVLELIDQRSDVQSALKAITAPYQNRTADELIRDTLHLPANHLIKDVHAKQAVLSAWLCYLRQNVGSCFATAPAILIHEEQPLQMLADMQELLATGRIKRVYGGVEFSAPLSISWGAGDIKKIVSLQDDSFVYSPGLIQALIAAQVISGVQPLSEQVECCKHHLEKVRLQLGEMPSVEDVLKAILMDQCGLTTKDIEEANLKEQTNYTSPLTSMSAPKGKERRVTVFENRYQQAQKEFKQLADNALLKSWEFTIASFSESKADFTRWNLYASLGLRPEQKGGLGACLYDYLQEKVNEYNQKAQEMQDDYERAYARLKYIEGRFQSASTEKEIQWMRAEYQSSRNEFYTLEEIRNDYHRRAQRFANLFNVLINEYDDLFFKYFQEVYDADLQNVTTGPYDDSPAGFRLVYKYGRTNTAQWSYINNQHEFIDCLSQFFSNTEIEIASHEAFQGLENDLSQIVSALIKHVRTIEFLETAFDRMAQAHHTPPVRDPLNNLDRIEKKPWVYTSGGTVNNLVSAYWGTGVKPADLERWVESPMELLVFMVDTIKQSPEKIVEIYKKNPNKRILIHSPTHAFNLQPGLRDFRESWEENAFTYTWLRDNLVKPRQEFVQTLILEEEMIEALLQLMAKDLPLELRAPFTQSIKQIHGRHTPIELQRELTNLFPRISPDWFDRQLYCHLPLLPINQFGERLITLIKECKEIPPSLQDKMAALYSENPIPYTLDRYIPIHRLIDAVKALYCLAIKKSRGELNIHQVVADSARRLGYAFPEPIWVADSNWVRESFAFVVNPGSGELDFWMVEPTGLIGGPVQGWRRWLDGSQQSPTWGIYSNPYEYTSKHSL